MSYDTDHFDNPPPEHVAQAKVHPHFRDGVEPDVPESDYHDSPRLSSTLLRQLDSSVADYLHRRDEDIDETDAMQLGSMVHQAVLEPGRFESEVLERPDPPVDPSEMSSTSMDLVEYMAGADSLTVADGVEATGLVESTVESRMSDPDHQALADHVAEYGPEPDPDHVERATAIREAVHEHPKIQGGLLDPTAGDSEVSVFWSHPSEPVRCKARPDYLREWGGGHLVVDLKTTGRSLGWWKRRGIWQRKYHLQSAWYRDGVEQVLYTSVEAFVFVVVETSEPHRVGIFELDGDTLSQARTRCDRAVARLTDYWLEPDQYLGPYREIETLTAPEWAL